VSGEPPTLDDLPAMRAAGARLTRGSGRVLITTNAAIGHVLPMAPTVAALVATGNEVRVACPGAFTRFVEGSGLPVMACRSVAVEAPLAPVPPR